MRAILAVLLWLPFSAITASAQALPAGRSGTQDFSLGYSYVNHPIGQSKRSGLNGFDSQFTVRLFSGVSIRGDLGYTRSGDLFGTHTASSVLSYMGGPVFSLGEQRRAHPYVEALFGGARVRGPIPVPAGVLAGGWAGRFAWSFGGGFDYELTEAIGVRGGVDYLRTTYYDSTLALRGQSNVRVTASVVYLFWRSRRKRV